MKTQTKNHNKGIFAPRGQGFIYPNIELYFVTPLGSESL